MCSQDFSTSRLPSCISRSATMAIPTLCYPNPESRDKQCLFSLCPPPRFHRPLCLADPFCPALTLLSQNHEIEGVKYLGYIDQTAEQAAKQTTEQTAELALLYSL